MPAVAKALLQLPQEFQTKDAVGLVADRLEYLRPDYHLRHFRYDLNKFRARHLLERIGLTRRYRLTSIGRVVCKVVAKLGMPAKPTRVAPTKPVPAKQAPTIRLAMSA